MDVYRNDTQRAYHGIQRRIMGFDAGLPEGPEEPVKPEDLKDDATPEERKTYHKAMNKWIDEHRVWKRKHGNTMESYRQDARSSALVELKKARRVSILSGDISPLITQHFKKDYNLGDIVTLFGNYGLNANMIVSEYVRTEDAEGERGLPGLVTDEDIVEPLDIPVEPAYVLQTHDMPAYNVYASSYGQYFDGTTVVGGPSCLVDPDNLNTYVELEGGYSNGFHVGAVDDSEIPEGTVRGFGVFNPPGGAIDINARFVAYGYRAGGGNLEGIDDNIYYNGGTPYSSNVFFSAPVVSYPAINFTYPGMEDTRIRPCISTFPIGSPGEATESDYIYPDGLLNGSPNGNGPGCRVFPYIEYPVPESVERTPTDHTPLRIYYLAIRVSYMLLDD